MYLFITNIICLKRKTHPSFLSFSICQRMRNPVVCEDIMYQMFIKEDPFQQNLFWGSEIVLFCLFFGQLYVRS